MYAFVNCVEWLFGLAVAYILKIKSVKCRQTDFKVYQLKMKPLAYNNIWICAISYSSYINVEKVSE